MQESGTKTKHLLFVTSQQVRLALPQREAQSGGPWGPLLPVANRYDHLPAGAASRASAASTPGTGMALHIPAFYQRQWCKQFLGPRRPILKVLVVFGKASAPLHLCLFRPQLFYNRSKCSFIQKRKSLRDIRCLDNLQKGQGIKIRRYTVRKNVPNHNVQLVQLVPLVCRHLAKRNIQKQRAELRSKMFPLLVLLHSLRLLLFQQHQSLQAPLGPLKRLTSTWYNH